VTNLNRIATFTRVAETGSFSAAARKLEVPTSSVSRAVAALEEDLGVRLLHRTTRKLTLTDAGEQYFATVRGALGAIEEANAAVSEQSREPRGSVRVTAAADFANLMFLDMIAQFTARYPKVHVEMMFTNRRVNLIEEGVDLAVRAGPLTDSSAIARRVGGTQLGLFASRAYVERNGAPRTVAQLAQHACIQFRSSIGMVPWRLVGPSGEEEVHVTGQVTVDGMNAAHAAVTAGLGIGLLPVVRFPGDVIDASDHVRVLPRYAQPGGPLSVVWATSKFLPRHVALLRDHMIDVLTRTMAATQRRG
jgi:DNA-binding transcriptional LysR family regulator